MGARKWQFSSSTNTSSSYSCVLETPRLGGPSAEWVGEGRVPVLLGPHSDPGVDGAEGQEEGDGGGGLSLSHYCFDLVGFRK